MTLSRRLMLLVPGNPAMHSELPRDAREWLLNNLLDVLKVFRSARCHPVLSLQSIDLELSGLTEWELQTCAVWLAHAQQAHVLHGMFEAPPETRWHMHKTDRHGEWGDVPIRVDAEFDVSSRRIYSDVQVEEGRIIQPVLSNPASIAYSLTGDGRTELVDNVWHQQAIVYRNRVLVPMVEHRLQQVWLNSFWEWQRDPDDSVRIQSLQSTLHTILRESQRDITILFMDLEAPFIGSHHGLEIWERFFHLLTHWGLNEAFVHPMSAVSHWRAQATTVPGATDLVYDRELGTKWLARRTQVRDMQAVVSAMSGARRDETDIVRWLFNVAAVSDLWSATYLKLHPRAPLPADKGPITIRHNQDVIDVCLKAREMLTKSHCRRSGLVAAQGFRDLGNPLADRYATFFARL